MNTQQILNMHILNWIPNSGVKPNLPDETYITVLLHIHDEDAYIYGKVKDIDWNILGQADDIIAYTLDDIRGMF